MTPEETMFFVTTVFLVVLSAALEVILKWYVRRSMSRGTARYEGQPADGKELWKQVYNAGLKKRKLIGVLKRAPVPICGLCLVIVLTPGFWWFHVYWLVAVVLYLWVWED